VLNPLFDGTTVLVADAALVAGWVGLDVVEMVEEEVDADVVKLVEAGAVVLVTACVKLKLWVIARGDVSPSTKMLKKNSCELERFMPPRPISQV
jgi:hypothetical protein